MLQPQTATDFVPKLRRNMSVACRNMSERIGIGQACAGENARIGDTIAISTHRKTNTLKAPLDTGLHTRDTPDSDAVSSSMQYKPTLRRAKTLPTLQGRRPVTKSGTVSLQYMPPLRRGKTLPTLHGRRPTKSTNFNQFKREFTQSLYKSVEDLRYEIKSTHKAVEDAMTILSQSRRRVSLSVRVMNSPARIVGLCVGRRASRFAGSIYSSPQIRSSGRRGSWVIGIHLGDASPATASCKTPSSASLTGAPLQPSDDVYHELPGDVECDDREILDNLPDDLNSQFVSPQTRYLPGVGRRVVWRHRSKCGLHSVTLASPLQTGLTCHPADPSDEAEREDT